VAIGALPYVDGDAREILEELAEADNKEIAEAAEAVLEEFSQTGYDDDEP
jgi:flagellar biosynthesis/type III secretory pathway protein FliH